MEEQQVELASTRSTSALPISQEQLARRQQRQALMLSRQHVIQQIEAARNPRHREMLQNALADLNARLAELE